MIDAGLDSEASAFFLGVIVFIVLIRSKNSSSSSSMAFISSSVIFGAGAALGGTASCGTAAATPVLSPTAEAAHGDALSSISKKCIFLEKQDVTTFADETCAPEMKPSTRKREGST